MIRGDLWWTVSTWFREAIFGERSVRDSEGRSLVNGQCMVDPCNDFCQTTFAGRQIHDNSVRWSLPWGQHTDSPSNIFARRSLHDDSMQRDLADGKYTMIPRNNTLSQMVMIPWNYLVQSVTTTWWLTHRERSLPGGQYMMIPCNYLLFFCFVVF